MSASRAERLERLRLLQERRRQTQEWRASALESRARDLAAEAEAILNSLGERSGLSGLFLEAKAQRLRRREAERADVLAQARVQREEARRTALVAKRLERLGAKARVEERGQAEGRSLADILDAHLVSHRASLE